MNNNSTVTLGYAEIITMMEAVRRKNRFIKVLLIFPAAFVAYAMYGGVGPFLQGWFQKFDVLITTSQIALFLHFLGKGNLIRGFNKVVTIFDGQAWQKNKVLNHISTAVADNLIPIFVNFMIFAGLMIGFTIGLIFLANFPVLQYFLENWNVLYPDAGAAPLYAFWKNSIIIPIGLSFLTVFINWLLLDKLNEGK